MMATCEEMVVSAARVESMGEPGWFENQWDESTCGVAKVDGETVAVCVFCDAVVEVTENADGSVTFPEHHKEG